MADVKYVEIQPGSFSPGNATPTGSQFVTFLDHGYVSESYYLNSTSARSIGVTATSIEYTTGEVKRKILQASGWINRICDRWFDYQRVWETHTGFMVRPYNPQLITVRADNGPPYNSINQMFIQVLQWFIPIVVQGPQSYLQDFYDKGFCKIVPLLSSAGTGGGSPLPAAIVDRVPLGVLWTDYTSGFGVQLTSYNLGTADGSTTEFQAAEGNQLWVQGNNLWNAPNPNSATPIVIYDNGSPVSSSAYDVDYLNGKITFLVAPSSGHAITADFYTYESIPQEIKLATILLTTYLLGKGKFNPMGHKSLSVPGLSISYGDEEMPADVKSLLEPYILNKFVLL